MNKLWLSRRTWFNAWLCIWQKWWSLCFKKCFGTSLMDSLTTVLPRCSLLNKFWAETIYTELLDAGCQFRAIREKEARRPATCLAKVTCVPFDGLAAHMYKGKRRVGTSQVSLLGDRCWAGSLLVWFPAAWMPLVAEALDSKNKAVAARPGTAALYASAEHCSSIGFKLKRWHADRTGLTPILHGSTNAPWFSLDPTKFVHLFPTIYEGMLSDVYCQKIATAWEHAAPTRVQVSLLLPSRVAADEWLYLMQSHRHLWPLQMSQQVGVLSDVQVHVFMRKERKRLRTLHIWEKLDLNWLAMKERLFAPGPTGKNWHQLYDILFCRTGQDTTRWQEAIYRGPGAAQLHENWGQWKEHFLSRRHRHGPMSLEMAGVFQAFEENEALVRSQLNERHELNVQVWRTRKGTYRKKQLPDVRDGMVEPNTG